MCEALKDEYNASTGTSQLLAARSRAPSGIAGLFFAISMLICGLLWLFGLWIPQPPRPWYAIMCLAAPLLVLFFFVASACLKCVYPIPPM